MWDEDKEWVFAKIIVGQRMFFDIWTMNDNLFSRDKKFPGRLSSFLNQDMIKQQMRQLLLRNYVAEDNRKPCVNIFLDCLGIYFPEVTADFGADLNTKSKSEFIKFWLYQIGDLDEQINSERDSWPMRNFASSLFFYKA